MKPLDQRVIVITPGIPVPLSGTPLPVRTLTVSAFAGNTTAVHIGGPNVRARAGEARGLPLIGGTRPDTWTWNDVDLSQIYIDAITASEGVTFLAWVE